MLIEGCGGLEVCLAWNARVPKAYLRVFCPDAEMGQRRRVDEEVGCGDGGLCAQAETSEDDWIDLVSVVRGPARPSVRSRRGW